MKKYLILLLSMLIGTMFFPEELQAFQHGYQRQTDEIYAIARYDLAVYYDDSEDDLIEYIPAFTGIRVVDSAHSWRIIEYTINKQTKTGWITEEDFYSDCLIYDGREKQILADGQYQITYQERLSYDSNTTGSSFSTDKLFSIPVTLTFAGNGSYYIIKTDTKEYLLPDPLFSKEKNHSRWGGKDEAGLFTLVRKDNYYGIQDTSTNRFLGISDNGFPDFHSRFDRRWRVVRTNGKVTDTGSLRVFAQYDPEWAMDYYGKGKNDDPESNNFCTSGCGIFSTMNAIYTLTGQYADPHLLAAYAVKKNYRIEDNGTDSGFFQAVAKKYGFKYGFGYDGATGSIEKVKEKIQKGDIAIAHVPGHYLAIADYNKKTDKFLLLDSHYLPARGTCPYGDWVPASALEDGGLLGYMFYFFKALEE